MRSATLTPEQQAELRTEWVAAVEQLAKQVRTWAEEQEWTVEESRKLVREESLGGEYDVPRLKIETPDGALILEPMARDVMGAKGRVDFCAYPSYYRVMLLRRQEPDWVVRTDSGLDWPQPWEATTFVTLAKGLLRAS